MHLRLHPRVILILASAVFFSGDNSTQPASLFDAYDVIHHLIGPAAATLFAVSLLAAGQSSSIIATVAGQAVSEGFLNWRVSPVVRRLLTRLIAVVPAMIVAIALGRPGINRLLVVSQVVLSIVLPFITGPLIYLTSSKRIMRVRKPDASVSMAAERDESIDFGSGIFVTVLGAANPSPTRRTTTRHRPQKKARLSLPPAGNPYKTLPLPTSSFIQLRFQLARFKGVYRVAQIPLNYTFANLYKLVLFMFGWSGQHAHRATVYSHVETYSGNYKAGHMKRYGKRAPLPVAAADDAAMLHYYELTRRTDIAEYEVVMMGRGTALQGFNYFGDFADDAEQRVEDLDLCLSQVWNQKLRKNASKGACGNKEMGVIYEYDLGASWEIHITMDREDDFFSVQPPSSLPIMILGKNKGAPPIEDAQDEIFGELEGRQKAISDMFFANKVFERYLKGEVSSRAGRTELEVREVARGAVHVQSATEDDDMENSSSCDTSDSSDSDSRSERLPPRIAAVRRPPRRRELRRRRIRRIRRRQRARRGDRGRSIPLDGKPKQDGCDDDDGFRGSGVIPLANPAT
ncbi:natural resistance-associated macrophage protein-domain-containing protein [Mycena maculata]|uniref:Natural resistance-associated macrophage protein-domain-containing protein n=1 Tax=Mycena maculata TaxID=230809 RepID=A0AAD7HJZ7_9AGAR|nr:natural resistance-associated macrophage protein-domain-containing protein [Mycena maculata]